MKIIKKTIIILFFALLFISILPGIGYTIYRINRVTLTNFIPIDKPFYIEINSFDKLYESVINLKVVDLILTNDKRLEGITKKINELRSGELSRNAFFKKLLTVKMTLFFTDNYTPVGITDLGGRSSLTNILSPIIPHLHKFVNGVIINKNQHGRFDYYEIVTLDGKSRFFAALHRNLFFISFDTAGLIEAFDASTGNNLSMDQNIIDLRKVRLEDGDIKVFMKSSELLNPVLNRFDITKKIVNQVEIGKHIAVSLKFTNERIGIDCFTNIRSEDSKISDFLNMKGDRKSSGRYLPEDSTIVTGANFTSFKSVIETFSLISEGDSFGVIKRADDSSRLLFNAGIDELFFDWIGNEAGSINVAGGNQPIIFLKIKDRNLFERAKQKLFSSILIEGESSYILNNVRMDHIRLPGLLKGIINYFIPDFVEPYYITIDDFIFFSLDPENLYNMVSKFEAKQFLQREESYKIINTAIDEFANLFFYYNLSLSRPSFIPRTGLLSDILGLYEKGVISVNLNDSQIRIKLSANGIIEKKLKKYPGFPRKTEKRIIGDLYCMNIMNPRMTDFVYQVDDGSFYFTDINNQPYTGFPIMLDGTITGKPEIIVNEYTGKKRIVISTDRGHLYEIDTRGNISYNKNEALDQQVDTLTVDAFVNEPVNDPPNNSKNEPIDNTGDIIKTSRVDFISSIPAKMYSNKKYALFNHTEKKMYFVQNEVLEEFNFIFKGILFRPPIEINNRLLFYPKSFAGEVYLTDFSGNISENWPFLINGIASEGPIVDKISGRNYGISLVTNSGELYLFGLDGTGFSGFPVFLDGVFNNQGVFGDFDGDGSKEIAVLDRNGKLFIVSTSGNIMLRRNLTDLLSKDNRLTVFDIDRDGKDDIFIYGTSNYIYAYNILGGTIPGFPQKGSGLPNFIDIDGDGSYEIVSGSFDGYIYCYTMPKF